MTIAELMTDPEAWISLLTLSAMEIVLGIDNIVFITILCGRLPKEQQVFARRVGIGLALISRLGLLFTLSWIMGLVKPLFTVMDHAVSGKDLLLLIGGMFLLGKATHEIYVNVEAPEEHGPDEAGGGGEAALGMILLQIIFLDIVFSLDSVITAVGMVPHVAIMAAAMVIAVIVMIIFVGPVGDFVERHASVRLLALAFLVLIGVLLIAEGFHHKIPKGYIYFAMGFSLMVEMINLRRRSKVTGEKAG